MFVLVSVYRNIQETVVGVFPTIENAIHSIPSYFTSQAGKIAIVYQMIPDGDKQKRLKIYEGTFPICSPKLNNDSTHNDVVKALNARIQKLEEKLEAKVAEVNNMKAHKEELIDMINRMSQFITV